MLAPELVFWTHFLLNVQARATASNRRPDTQQATIEPLPAAPCCAARISSGGSPVKRNRRINALIRTEEIPIASPTPIAEAVVGGILLFRTRRYDTIKRAVKGNAAMAEINRSVKRSGDGIAKTAETRNATTEETANAVVGNSLLAEAFIFPAHRLSGGSGGSGTRIQQATLSPLATRDLFALASPSILHTGFMEVHL